MDNFISNEAEEMSDEELKEIEEICFKGAQKCLDIIINLMNSDKLIINEEQRVFCALSIMSTFVSNLHDMFGEAIEEPELHKFILIMYKAIIKTKIRKKEKSS